MTVRKTNRMDDSNDNTILRVEKIGKRFNGFSLEVDELSFQKGRIYGLTGPNGSGKTTLLCMLNLLQKPDSGDLFFKGESCLRSPSKQLSVRRNMAMVLENPYLFRKTVLKNVMYGLRVRGVNRAVAREKACAALELVNMQDFANRKAYHLSRGETQRVAIARAIASEPEVLFLDEPFTNIDRIHVVLVEDLLRSLNREQHMTIVLTTHDLFQAYRMSEEVFSLVNGKVLRGSIENLYAGTVVSHNGAKFVSFGQGITIQVVTEKEGGVHLVIPPEDIILSTKPFESSARNVLKGSIRSIEMERNKVRIVCDAGEKFVSLITRESFQLMHFAVGGEVFLTFKTTSVNVF